MSEGRLTTPRCFGAGWDAGREQSHAPPARRRRVPRPAPEVALVPHGPRRSCGEPTPRRLRGTRGPRADAGPASQAVARPAPSAGGRAGPAVPASAASRVASVAARRPSSFSAVSKPIFASKYALELAICLYRNITKSCRVNKNYQIFSENSKL